MHSVCAARMCVHPQWSRMAAMSVQQAVSKLVATLDCRGRARWAVNESERVKKGEADLGRPTPPRTGGRLISWCCARCQLRSPYENNHSPNALRTPEF